MNDGCEFGAVRNVQRSHAVRPVEFVPSQGEEIDAERVHDRRKVERRLSGICVENERCVVPFFVSSQNACNFSKRLYDPYLIVRPADGDKDHLRLEGTLDSRRSDDAPLVGVDVRNHSSHSFDLRKTFEHGVVLDRTHDPVCAGKRATYSLKLFCIAEYCKIIRLCKTGGEDELARLAAEQLRDARARVLERTLRRNTFRMNGAWVPDERFYLSHRTHGLRQNRRRARVVEIYAPALRSFGEVGTFGKPHTREYTRTLIFLGKKLVCGYTAQFCLYCACQSLGGGGWLTI